MTLQSRDECDVAVIGAGIGGLYAAYRFHNQGLSVIGLEAGGGVGGVWYHNCYPGARVDVDSIDYCYYFSAEVARLWRWTERYAAQPELLRYLGFVADHHDLRRHFRFNTRLVSGLWNAEAKRWCLSTSTGGEIVARFVVLATGNLSEPRRPDFRGLESFKGEWVQTNRWPEREVPIEGRRVGVIGTGSTGVQVVTAVAPLAAELTVFQRTANYAVPAVNRPLDESEQLWLAENLADERERLLQSAGGVRRPPGGKRADEYTEAEQLGRLEDQWAFGGQGMNRVFSDQGTNADSNRITSNFVRSKILATVNDEQVARALLPTTYPIGTRRLALDTGYYETFNRENVRLVDIRADPILEFTPTGIRTSSSEHNLDLVIFALGFHAFTGAINAAHLRNSTGASPTDSWRHGPRTILGLMTPGFPNLFFPTGAGSPSVLSNLFLCNEFCLDWIGDAISYLDEHGQTTIEATPAGAAEWQAEVARAAEPLLRLQVDNYMVHVGPDGSRVFMPYIGGLGAYVEHARDIAANGYRGFTLDGIESSDQQPAATLQVPQR